MLVLRDPLAGLRCEKYVVEHFLQVPGEFFRQVFVAECPGAADDLRRSTSRGWLGSLGHGGNLKGGRLVRMVWVGKDDGSGGDPEENRNPKSEARIPKLAPGEAKRWQKNGR